MKPITVDLKWSLWSTDKGTWEDYSPGTWDRMRAAFRGEGEPVTLYLSPRKEIRFGTVEISKGQAFVEMHTQWDPPYCHVPDTITDRNDQEVATEQIEEWFEGNYGFHAGDIEDPIGAMVGHTIKSARNFPSLMRSIDKLENDLLHEDADNYETFKDFLKEIEAECQEAHDKERELRSCTDHRGQP